MKFPRIIASFVDRFRPPVFKPLPIPPANNLLLLLEKEGREEVLSIQEVEQLLGFSYVPRVQCQKKSYFYRICRKTWKMQRQGLLDHEQLWLGAYFAEEIKRAAVPAVRLKWIDASVGWGVFAERDLDALEYIGEYAGLLRRKRGSDGKNSYCFNCVVAEGEDSPYVIDAQDQGGISRFINHSSKPNLSSDLATLDYFTRVIFYTTRAVRKGEQLFYDYGPYYWKKRPCPIEL